MFHKPEILDPTFPSGIVELSEPDATPVIVKTESASSLSATCAEYKLNVSVVALGAIAVECVRSVATGAALLLIDMV